MAPACRLLPSRPLCCLQELRQKTAAMLHRPVQGLVGQFAIG